MAIREGLLDGVNVSHACSNSKKLTLHSIPYKSPHSVSGDTLRALL
jgi:hypothetical protein